MLKNIQILRFVAAMAVVFHHVPPYAVAGGYSPNWPLFLRGVFEAGFAGVDLFFVLSGVVMAESTRALAPGMVTGLRFVGIRFARIYLGWWPFFALYFFLIERGHPRPEVSLVGSFLLLPVGFNEMLLNITWTLGFELYFYLVLGFLLVLPRTRLRVALWAWAAAVLAFTLYSLARGLYQPEHFGEVTIGQGFFGAPLVLEFIAGFLLCDYLRKNPGLPWLPFAASGLLLGALATCYQIYGNLHASGLAGYFHGPERALLIGGAACSIAACALLLREPTRPVALWASKMGDASYAIYLSHIMVVSIFYLLVVRAGVPQNYKLSLFVLAITAVILYSWLHFRWIEHPLYRAVRRKINKRPADCRAG